VFGVPIRLLRTDLVLGLELCTGQMSTMVIFAGQVSNGQNLTRESLIAKIGANFYAGCTVLRTDMLLGESQNQWGGGKCLISSAVSSPPRERASDRRGPKGRHLLSIDHVFSAMTCSLPHTSTDH